MAEMRHVAIAGAGIIGLSCALELRRRGLTVTVYEAGDAMREASWAAGGMLAVDDPENPGALRPLSRYSRSIYEGFLAEISRLSGHTIPWRTHHTLQVLAEHRRHPALLALTTAQASSYVPGLAHTADRYLLLDEVSLNPRDLCAAQPVAARAAGIALHEHTAVTHISHAEHGVLIGTESGTLAADIFLNCCGAWSAGLSELHHRAPHIAPRKGQMMVVAAPVAPRLTWVLRSPEVYLIPRGDGRIAVGATVEDAGYSKEVDPAALAHLGQRAAELWPPIADAPLVESWAGLRPGTSDELPLIGQETPGDATRWIAAGHFRNGILLAPGTAACIAASIMGEVPPVDLTPFTPQRTCRETACDKDFAPAL